MVRRLVSSPQVVDAEVDRERGRINIVMEAERRSFRPKGPKGGGASGRAKSSRDVAFVFATVRNRLNVIDKAVPLDGNLKCQIRVKYIET